MSVVTPALAGGDPPAAAGATCKVGSIQTLGTRRVSFAAHARHALDAYRSLSKRDVIRFKRKNVNGAPTVFAVLAAELNRSCLPRMYKIQVPIRPNGSTAWIRAADVEIRVIHTRISVDLSRRRITLFEDGRPVLVTTAAIGAPSTPTPTGRFYVNQRLLSGNPLGDYGPGAVGLSAFSPVLLNWPQGGPIAIHGTNAPQMIGFAISHGCLRVRNDDIRHLLRVVQEGTPVEITP
jgi:lipoprotein-anchoring transpeptidase ErfK/SrfK